MTQQQQLQIAVFIYDYKIIFLVFNFKYDKNVLTVRFLCCSVSKYEIWNM